MVEDDGEPGEAAAELLAIALDLAPLRERIARDGGTLGNLIALHALHVRIGMVGAALVAARLGALSGEIAEDSGPGREAGLEMLLDFMVQTPGADTETG